MAAFERVLAACRGGRQARGIHAGSPAYAARMAAKGFDLVTVWVDAIAVTSTLAMAAEVWNERA